RSPLLCLVGTALAAAVVWTAWAPAQQPDKKPTGLEERKPPAAPVESPEDFAKEMAKFKADKPGVMKTQLDLLNARYDLSDKPSKIKMSGNRRPVQEGVRVRLPNGLTWDALAAMSPEEIKKKGVFPQGFLPLPHPHHDEGGMIFPKFHIDEIKKQEARDLTRFDLDHDIPEHLLPEFPPAIFLTTRHDLGDISKGKLVTID